MTATIARRDFVAGLAGAALMAPLTAGAQQSNRVRRVGVLMGYGENDAEAQDRVRMFQRKLEQLGWVDGRNIAIDIRWGGADDELVRKFAKELVQLKPDVIVGQSTPSARALRQETNAIPIVFLQVTDPVDAGFVASLARPGGNLTGFAMYEPEMGTKWRQILKEIDPGLARVAVMLNPETAPGRGTFFLRSIEAVSSSLSVKPFPIEVHNATEIERAIEAFAREPNGGLLVPPDVTTQFHRDLIVNLAARHQIPAVYSQRFFVTIGGLISYGVDTADQYQRTASYVDRILRGEKPSELPVQGPTKFEMAINLKTANALGLTVPVTLQVTADG